MDKKLLKLQRRYLKEIKKYGEMVPDRDLYLEWEIIHMASSSAIAYDLAIKRNVDPLLAACACAVHDYGRIISGRQLNHAEVGFEPVKEFLAGTELFTEEEISEMALAVKNHSLKSEVGSKLEEIVKDADVLDMVQHGFDFTREEQKRRYEMLV